ncbi:MAG: DNA-binding protein WhiA [Streptococcaceae bacterium]|jgi:DNA-binding protein WhiA|nr:DNA-binding protein WhiA [Streptococcaceae bacterium]
MSFSSEVKNELAQMPATTGTLLALIRMNGSLLLGVDLQLVIVTSSARTARAIYQMLLDLYEIRAEVTQEEASLRKSYRVRVSGGLSDLLDDLQLTDSLLLDDGVPQLVLSRALFQADYLRGAFLSAGSVSNPERAYMLEIVSKNRKHAIDLQMLLVNFGILSALTESTKGWILYLSNAAVIADFLTTIGATHARLEFEAVKLLREMRGLANRQANFEAANITKTVKASQETIKAIDALIAANQLPETLLDMATARLAHPESTLTELGALVSPPLSKSAVARRLRKIEALAHKLSER